MITGLAGDSHSDIEPFRPWPAGRLLALIARPRWLASAYRRAWQFAGRLSDEGAISLLLMYILYLAGRTRFHAIGGYF